MRKPRPYSPRLRFLFAACAVVVVMMTPHVRAAPGLPTTAPIGEFHAKVLPLLEQYCYECHGDGSSSGDLEMDRYKTLADVRGDVKTWQKIIQYARTQTMPPPKADQPTQEERDALVETLHRELYQIDPANPDAGRVTIRRLNRSEYRNTVRDLVGVSFDPTLDFPQDDTGYGFDNIADVLTLPPMLMEKYLAAAERILDEAISTDGLASRERRIPAAHTKRSSDSSKKPSGGDDEWVMLSSVNEDSLSVPMQSPVRADYVVRVLAYAKPTADAAGATSQPITMSLMLGDTVATTFDVTALEDRPQWYEARVGVPAGKQTIRASLLRQRSATGDLEVSAGRVGRVQPGEIFVKEIVIEGPVRGAVRRIDEEKLTTTGFAERHQKTVSFPRSDDEVAAQIDVQSAGEHLLRVQAFADQAGDEPARMELLLDGKSLAVFDVTAPSHLKSSPHVKELSKGSDRALPHVYEVRTNLSVGKHQLAARFLNDLWLPDHEEPNRRDRNLYVQNFEVVNLSGPPLPPPMPPPLRELFVKHAGWRASVSNSGIAPNDKTTRALLEEFTRRAWRRPLQRDEVDRVMKLYTLARTNGESFHGAVKHAMKGVLVSSSFLFRGEPQMPQIQPNLAKALNQSIGEHELASRLSYFLWGSMPDDELLNLAGSGELRKNLPAQVKRMLASPKSEAFVDNFAGQWLQFRNLDAVHPDRKLFKAYTDRLRDSMQRETKLFFTYILKEDRSLLDVLTGEYTFVDERLAKHYGLKDDVKGEEFKRVSLVDTPRRGVMTQGSVLTLTSNPTRTSPVKRGKWVLENLLGNPPPPPPANVPPLETDDKPLTGNLRQRMEQHRASKSCASCHAALDPIGFGLENFDAIGAWRDKDGQTPVDASSAFANGAKFTGPAELAELLATTRRKDFYRSVTESALTFALGRGVEPFDQPAVDTIVRDLQANDGKISSLVFGVVNSVPFQYRRAETGAGTAQARMNHMTSGTVHE